MTNEATPSKPAHRDALPGLAPDEDSPIPYMARTRDWYLALGYDNPYRFAHYLDVPFQPLKRPLAASTLTVLTTAAPYQPDKGPQGPGAPYNAAAKFYVPYAIDPSMDHDLRVSHVSIDRKHTSMEDSNSWFPLSLVRKLVKSGRVGRLAGRFHGVPTNRSQRRTLEGDAPRILAACLQDGVDVAVLIPNCPVCHQTLCLLARTLEAAGISTVVMGCAKDIVEHVGVPRFLFSDFPLGNSAGKPNDPVSQAETLELALRLLETAPAPRTTVQSPQRWSNSHLWKQDFFNIKLVSPEEVARLRAESDDAKATAKAVRESTIE